MQAFFNNIFNTLIRNLNWEVRILISFIMFCVAIVSLILSIRKKNDAAPLSIGWFILSMLSILIGVLYISV